MKTWKERKRSIRDMAVGVLIGLICASPLYVFATGWTAPRTWVANETLTAALMNTFVRDDFLHLKEQSDLHPSVVYVSTSPVGNVGTGEDDLMSYSMPGGTLSTDNWSAYAEASGTFANATTWSTLQIKAYFGGSSALVVSTGALGVAPGFWSATVKVIRKSLTTQEVWVEGKIYQDNGVASLAQLTAASSGARRLAATETLSGAVTLKLTGELTGTVANDDVSQKAMEVHLRRAP